MLEKVIEAVRQADQLIDRDDFRALVDSTLKDGSGDDSSSNDDEDAGIELTLLYRIPATEDALNVYRAAVEDAKATVPV